MSNDGKHHLHSEGVLNSATFISDTHVLGYNVVTFGSVLHTLL